MHTVPYFQDAITAICDKHGLILTTRIAHLRLEQETYQPLVIEKIGTHLISVAHYAYQNGDAMPDPDVVCFTGYPQWVPIEISQILGYQCAAWLDDSESVIEKVALDAQRAIAQFCESWARAIKAQCWLENGVCLRGVKNDE